MNDEEIHDRIERLVAEEHALQTRHGDDGLSPAEHRQLEEMGVSLDRLWDLLRQRRARREAGLDPNEAQLRGEGYVEGYQQ